MKDWLRNAFLPDGGPPQAPTSYRNHERRAAMRAEMAALANGQPLCALCCHVLGHGPNCYRCARFQ